MFLDALEKTNKKYIVVVGMETHICVLQTVLDLLHNNYTVTVLSDATISRNLKNHEEALNFYVLRGRTYCPLSPYCLCC